ncbi:MAG: ABC transporter permease [Terracidiphilus sp.]
MSGGSFVTRGVSRLRSWLRAVIRRDQLEERMESELACHLEILTSDLIQSGISQDEAARRARIALGAALKHKEEMRASLGLHLVDELGADSRYAWRMLRKAPGSTLIAVASLALAIGANTTIFSIARQLLYQQLSVPHAGDLRLLRWNGDNNSVVHGMLGDADFTPQSGTTASIFSYPVYEQLRAHNRVLEDLFAYKEESMNATIHGDAQNVNVVMVSGNYFDSIEDPRMWQREFGRSPGVIGQTITLNQVRFTVIGVTQRNFTGMRDVTEKPDVFVPLAVQPVVDPMGNTSLLKDPDMWWVNVMARSKPGINDQRAQTALQVQFEGAIRSTMTVSAGDSMPRLAIVNGSRGLHFSEQRFKKPLYILLGLTGFVILLACANIANLLLARGAQRQREMSVRLAMGAGRSRIVRQLLTESLLLAAMGGALGLVLGYFGRNILPNLLTNAWERRDINTPFSWPVFAFAAAVTLATGILFGLAPALYASRTELSGSLKDTAQQATRRRKGLTGRSIVSFQIALSTLLVIGAGLFARTLIALDNVKIGFNADHLLLFQIAPPAHYSASKVLELHEQLEKGFSALPGVESVSASAMPYLANGWLQYTFLREDETFEQYRRLKKGTVELANFVDVNFFKTMQIPIVAGRGFAPQDTSTSERVAVINQTLARKRFPDMNPVGKRFRMDRNSNSPLVEIVGICADARYATLRQEPAAQFLIPYSQFPEEIGNITFEIRTSVPPATLEPSLRKVVQSGNPDLPIVDLRTQREQIDATTSTERAFAALTAGFGLLALLLACVGIYGIMAYAVAQRTSEIGVRLALGAIPRQVLAMVLREASWISGAGIAIGLGASIVLARFVGSMLYGVAPSDPLTLSSAAALLLLVALGASWIPARRASSIQPIEALRHE